MKRFVSSLVEVWHTVKDDFGSVKDTSPAFKGGPIYPGS